jgi:hypothetical protein
MAKITNGIRFMDRRIGAYLFKGFNLMNHHGLVAEGNAGLGCGESQRSEACAVATNQNQSLHSQKNRINSTTVQRAAWVDAVDDLESN